MQKLYEAADRVEAQMLKDYLEEQNIATVMLGDFLSGGAGELPANLFPALWLVKDEQLTRAKWLIDEYMQNKIESKSGAWRCPSCGESVDAGFEICWNCSTPGKKVK
ncbi:MAG: DUF2007 domain-containing protein [Candidatus Thiodiazotropha sp. (ex Monitilora ramsayi)]|nr:DUF2007 domain-containing protein [Candidatus Thiodiazotropha sp. (ex Monitilora ramsayi)]